MMIADRWNMQVKSFPITCLVVDDNPDKSQPLKHWLERQEYSVEFESDSERAINAVRLMLPDVILVNADLPDKRGLDVCRCVKGNDLQGFIPVIAMLGPEPGLIEEALDAGADDVLARPVQQAELLTRINVLLRVKRRYDVIWQQNQALNRELEKRNQELEHALKESREVAVIKDSIGRNVSHELKTPLLQVKSAVNMLAEDARTKSRKGGTVLTDHATAATRRLESVILNITQLAA